MNMSPPKLPDYEFSWRSIQVEPVPMSGERITLGLIVKGADQTLRVVKLVSADTLCKMYGAEYGGRILDALDVCVESAQKHYKNTSLINQWSAPLGNFHVGEVKSSLAENIEDGIASASVSCSSFAVAAKTVKSEEATTRGDSAPLCGSSDFGTVTMGK